MFAELQLLFAGIVTASGQDAIIVFSLALALALEQSFLMQRGWLYRVKMHVPMSFGAF